MTKMRKNQQKLKVQPVKKLTRYLGEEKSPFLK